MAISLKVKHFFLKKSYGLAICMAISLKKIVLKKGIWIDNLYGYLLKVKRFFKEKDIRIGNPYGYLLKVKLFFLVK